MTREELVSQISSLKLTTDFTGIKFTVQTYQLLKRARSESKIDDSFVEVYRSFYAMRSSKAFNDAYFNLMRECIKTNNFSLDHIINNLENKDMGKDGKGSPRFQFSYMTKLLNILNDQEYPIYDSMVAKVFGYKDDITPIEKSEHKTKKEVLISRYEHIQHIYKEVIPKLTTELENFKSLFDCKELADMRVIDILVWQIGKMEIQQEDQQRKKNKANE